MTDPSTPAPPSRILVRVVLFLLFFTAVLLLVSYRFLFPVIEAAKSPDLSAAQKHELAALSRLMLAVLLFVLVVGLFLVFPLSRFFFPRRAGQRTKTQYVDAWKESANRMETPPAAERDEE